MHLQHMHLQLMRLQPKLLFVGATPPVDKPSLGGNERYLLNALELVRSMGVETHYVNDGAAGYEALFEQAAALGAELHQAPFCTDPKAGAQALDALIAQIQPTMLHVNGHSGWLEPVLARARRLEAARQRVYTMHLPVATLEAQAIERFDWKKKLPGRWTSRQLDRDRRFLSAFDHVLTVSRRFGELAEELGYVEPGRVRFIPNGVDTELYQPRSGASAEFLPADRPVRIGSACRLTTVKRIDLLIEAFAALGPSLPAELHIAGEGPEQAALREQAERLGLGERVRFHGFRQDVPQFLQEVDVFAISSDEEAAPYSQLEAMATGLPAAVTAVGDLPYIVRDGVDGFVSPRGDLECLTASLRKLTGEPEVRRRMGESARARAVEEFSSQVWLERMRSFFEERLAVKTSDVAR